jgi:transcriptional regulator with XRE-family HTH domain
VTIRQQLADDLRSLRTAANLTGPQLADRLGVAQSTISRVENAKTTPSSDLVERWARACAASDEQVAQLLTQAENLSLEGTTWRLLHRAGLKVRQDEIGRIEAAALAVRVFQPVMVPGLLQIADYARRVMLQGNPSDQPDIAEAVAARIRRQTILYDPHKQFEFVVTESALRWRPGPPELMRSQLSHLASVASLPNVKLGVIPQDIEAPDAYLHPFVMFESSAERLVTVETYTAEMVIRDDRDIALYERTLERFRSVCKWSEEATTAIRAMAT